MPISSEWSLKYRRLFRGGTWIDVQLGWLRKFGRLKNTNRLCLMKQFSLPKPAGILLCVRWDDGAAAGVRWL